MTARQPTPIVLALVERDGRFLVRRREPGKHLAGHWEFPGGKIAFGESPEDAVARECREEVGITPRDIRFAGVVSHVYHEDDVHVILLAYRCRAGADAHVTDPGARWVTREEAAGLEMPAANARVLGILET